MPKNLPAKKLESKEAPRLLTKEQWQAEEKEEARRTQVHAQVEEHKRRWQAHLDEIDRVKASPPLARLEYLTCKTNSFLICSSITLKRNYYAEIVRSLSGSLRKDAQPLFTRLAECELELINISSGFLALERRVKEREEKRAVAAAATPRLKLVRGGKR